MKRLCRIACALFACLAPSLGWGQEFVQPAAEAGGACGESLCLVQNRGDCGWVSAGASAVIVRPFFEDSVGLLRGTMTPNGVAIQEESFDYDFEISPRIWLAYHGSRSWGVQATYWRLDASAGELSGTPAAPADAVISPLFFDSLLFLGLPLLAGPGETLTAAAHLELETLDLEATGTAVFGCWALTASGGVRFARMEQSYRATLSDALGLIGQIDSSHRFEGAGPTMSLEVRRGCRGLAAFARTRGSVLVGDGDLQFVETDFDIPLSAAITGSRNDVLAISELQLGLQASRCVGPGVLFAECALEGQTWFGAGSPLSEDGNLGLLGISLTLGGAY